MAKRVSGGQAMRRIYEFRVLERLSPSWSKSFEGVQLVSCSDGGMVLRGILADQAALYGVLARIRDLGLTLISVNSEAVQGPSGISTTLGAGADGGTEDDTGDHYE